MDNAVTLPPTLAPTTAGGMVVAVKQTTFVNRHKATWQAFDKLCQELGVELTAIVSDTTIALPNTPLPNLPNSDSQNAITGDNSLFAHNLKPSGAAVKKPSFAEKKRGTTKNSAKASYPMIRLYRQICQHYALAKQRHYSPQLVAQLHQRVMVGHQLIYQSQASYLSKVVDFITYGFPIQLRQHKRLFWLAFALFYVPLFAMLIGCYLNHELIHSVMSPSQVAEMEYMYDPANAVIGRGMERQADTDMMMFGVYISNNIGIDFQMYASGLFFGIGTILRTIYNGVVIGAVAGHLTQLGFGSTFWSFVCGHGSFELTAAVIASAAGLRLAQPLIAPYPYNRKDAFIVAGKQSIQLLLGAAMMTFLAAFIEAFWSSSKAIPNEVKYGVALLLWTFVACYLGFAGRGKAFSDEFEQQLPMTVPINLPKSDQATVTQAGVRHEA